MGVSGFKRSGKNLGVKDESQKPGLANWMDDGACHFPRVSQGKSRSGEQSEFDVFVEHEKKDAKLDSSLEVEKNLGRMYKLVNH